MMEIRPTRSGLIEVKRRIEIAKKGWELLKRKRDALVSKFFKIMEQTAELRRKVNEKYAKAYEKLSLAKAVEGTPAIVSAAMSVREAPEIDVSFKNIMGVKVPKVKSKGKIKRKIWERGYGILGTSTLIDEVSKEYEELLEMGVKLTELENTLVRLLDEIDKNKRRVNALEYIVIPNLERTSREIRFKLEEMEREDIFRLKRFKR